MFDFSPWGILAAFAASLWTSLSPVTEDAVLVALTVGILSTLPRSPTLRAALLGLAVASGAFAGAWQSAATEGARAMLVRDHAIALAAERERGTLAEAIAHDLAEQSTRDLEEAQADARNLKGLNDALARDPRLHGVCLPRDIARRLRAL